MDGRPDTPSYSVGSMDKDEREEFLRRENELSDQLAEKAGRLSSMESTVLTRHRNRHCRPKKKVMADLRDEIAYLKEQEGSASKVRHRSRS